MEDRLLLSTFLVRTTADSGPGSLRQAILDSDTATGATNTIDFDISGTGIRTIAPNSPLPPITNPVLIDGTSQPGFAGTPLIDLTGQALSGSDPLSIASSVSVRGVAIGGFARGGGTLPDELTVASVPLPGSGVGGGGTIDSYRLVATTDQELTVVLHAQGGTARLLLLDAGAVLMQSDGQSAAAGDDLIDLYVPAGSYSLEVQSLGGAGTYSLTATSSPATSPRQPILAGNGPSSVVSGDFNGDGHLDLAVANEYDNTVSVLMGNGDGTFAPQVAYSVRSNPNAITAGDFTGDGHLDLATANGDVTVSVLLGNGDGTFAPQVTYAVGSGPSAFPDAIVAGDFTGDGHLDLAVANEFADTVSVLLGDGNGTIAPEATYAVGLDPVAIAAGDFTGDGHLDLAVANLGAGYDTVSLLLGDGDGTFQSLSRPRNAVGVVPVAIVSGDFTGDGHLDLATANVFADTVSVLLGNGDGTFQPQVTYPVGSAPFAIVAGDFNGDGRLDLAVADNGSNAVSVLMGNGDGTFQPAVNYPVGLEPFRMVAGDFAGNGRLDLAVVDYGSNAVSILLGNGDGTFQPAQQYAAGSGPFAIAAGDFTGDGHLDLAVTDFGTNLDQQAGAAGAVSILLGNGDGTFRPPAGQYAVGTYPSSIVTGDFAGNGHVDLAVANQVGPSVSVLMGNGDGTFQPAVSYAAGLAPYFVVAGDFRGNGKLDLAVDNTVSVLRGNGDGTFAPQATYAVGSGPYAIVAGDFTGDGHLDLATANGYDGTVSVLLGKGDGTFTAPGQLATTPHATPLVADVTGDGTDDVLVVDGAGNILYRQGIPGQAGSFEPPVTINPGDPSRDIAWVPETDQGPLLASVDAHDNAVSFYAYRDGGFVKLSGSLTTGRLPAQIIAADLNGDGLTDLVVRNAGDGTLSIFFGTAYNRSPFVGPINPQLIPPSFLAAVTLPAGLGVSDVEAVNASGGGIYLVVTNQLTGEVSTLGDGSGGVAAAPNPPYRAGTSLYALDISGGSPVVTSLEATAGVAAGAFTTGGPTDLATINPGTETLGLLAGLGNGRFANPVTLYTGSPPQVVRVADFTGNGVDDLAVLTTSGVSIYLGNGKGGFLPPTTYAVPPEADGLTVADINHDGKLDLLVGDAYGDVLVLQGQGDGTFQPYHEANQAVELAVADLTGNGAKDII